MIYAKLEKRWPVEVAETDFPGSNRTFETYDELENYKVQYDKWKPLQVFARMVNGYPLEISDTDWPGRTRIFESLGEYLDFCETNAASKPVVVQEPPQISEQSIWWEKLLGGWVDPVTGLKLKTTEPARILFSDAMGLMREELDTGEITGDTLRPIWDYDEQMHVLKVNDLRALLRRYGKAWQQMFAEFAP